VEKTTCAPSNIADETPSHLRLLLRRYSCRRKGNSIAGGGALVVRLVSKLSPRRQVVGPADNRVDNGRLSPPSLPSPLFDPPLPSSLPSSVHNPFLIPFDDVYVAMAVHDMRRFASATWASWQGRDSISNLCQDQRRVHRHAGRHTSIGRGKENKDTLIVSLVGSLLPANIRAIPREVT
jgi:hypothetical protein